ncbi:MAG: hypothetical protein JWR43_365 [Phenylobacterium sp.]|jgi:hypothetical protein|nr:hypothetical protein [Phenylobacterium sp.]
MKTQTPETWPRLAVWLAGLLSVIITAGAVLAASGAHAGPYRAPRTSFGVPDLQGLWTNTSLTFLQRPPVFKALAATDAEAAMMEGLFKKMVGDLLAPFVDPKLPAPPVVKEAPQSDYLEMDMHLARINGQMRSSWIVDPADGRVPFTDVGKKARAAAVKEDFDGPEGRPTEERCLQAIGSPEGPPMMNTGFNANYQIVETPGYVAIHTEMNHDVRIIRMGDRRHLPASVRPWMGDSVGWWDGDTLVVETTNFPKDFGVGSLGGGFTYSPQGKLTERFTRTAKDQILYQFSVDDPAYFKQPWRAEMPMRPAKGPIYEYACHEGNYSLPNALSGARAQERNPDPAAPPTTGR